MQATAAPRGHVRHSRYRRTFRVGHLRDLHVLRWLVPSALGIGAVLALVLAIDPAHFASAIAHLNLLLLPAIVAVSIAYYVIQGIRWHFLLVDVGIRMRLRDVVLITLAGQATSFLPLGELTRAILVTQASGGEFGAAVAAETVQELLYTVILIAFAVPGLLAVPHALAGIVVILFAIAAIIVAMTWCRMYRYLRLLVSKTPLLRRVLHPLDELHNDLVVLMRKPGTITWSWLSVLQAAAMVTTLWLVAQAVAPGHLDWKSAALVYAVSNVAGLLSLIPAGVGAYEGSIIGLLVGFGLNPGVAAAIAVLQRVLNQGIATGVGFAAYGVARRRLHVGGLGTLTVRSAGRGTPADAAA
ncbi:MAG: flippase-like domain-containing protein [Candidatus Dormibacteraeota bacterium]|nr:flippase-like domain-containing protein [Candidatus Dormibacteraeota bacterium]